MDFKNKLILAPLSGITIKPYRILCRKYGADITVAPMIHENHFESGLDYGFVKGEKPIIAQLFGKNPENMLKSALLLEKKADGIDINLGCPSIRIIDNGEGSALLKDSGKIKAILSSLNSNLKKPLTCKIRIIKDKKKTLEIAKIAEKYCDAITIHARTQKQGYSGKADWNVIKHVKKNIGIPVIGNGDIIDEKSAAEMLKVCDSAMIGRAALGDPMIFERIKKFLDKDEIIEINDIKEYKKKMFIEFSKMFNGKFIELRQFAMYFSKGIRGSRELRQKIMLIKNKKELIEFFTDL